MEQPIMGRIEQLTNNATPFTTQHETRHRQENELRAEIRKIVNEELDRRGISLLKATCPPKLLQALLTEFPYLLSDSPEWKTRNDSLPADFPNL